MPIAFRKSTSQNLQGMNIVRSLILQSVFQSRSSQFHTVINPDADNLFLYRIHQFHIAEKCVQVHQLPVQLRIKFILLILAERIICLLCFFLLLHYSLDIGNLGCRGHTYPLNQLHYFLR